jgi:hypothetical protein
VYNKETVWLSDARVQFNPQAPPAQPHPPAPSHAPPEKLSDEFITAAAGTDITFLARRDWHFGQTMSSASSFTL